MRQITLLVADGSVATILGKVADQVEELRVERVPDAVPAASVQPAATPTEQPPAARARPKRGDKTAADIVLDMFDDENTVRSKEAIRSHMVRIGFAENTAASTISKLVQDGKLERLGTDAVRIKDTDETPS